MEIEFHSIDKIEDLYYSPCRVRAVKSVVSVVIEIQKEYLLYKSSNITCNTYNESCLYLYPSSTHHHQHKKINYSNFCQATDPYGVCHISGLPLKVWCLPFWHLIKMLMTKLISSHTHTSLLRPSKVTNFHTGIFSLDFIYMSVSPY